MLFRSLFSGLLLLGLSACSPSVTPPAEVAPASTPADMPAATPVAATPATTPTTAPTTAPAPPEPAAGLAAAPANPALAPRPGVDYDVLPTPQPTYGQGKIEVAEVFSYRCIHCAEFQPAVNAWMASKPADVRFEYVPAVFGGTWDDFARA